MAADRLIKIDNDMAMLIERYARSEKQTVRLWMCELLADLADRKKEIIEEVGNDEPDTLD